MAIKEHETATENKKKENDLIDKYKVYHYTFIYNNIQPKTVYYGTGYFHLLKLLKP